MNLLRKFLILSLISISVIAIAYETDNFTLRYQSLPDMRDVLSDEMNKSLQDSEIALKDKGCGAETLVKAVHGNIGGWSVGKLESFADESETVQRHRAPKEDIYFGRPISSVISGFMMSLAGRTSSINLDGQYVGVDKLGHFIDQGYEYYLHYKKTPDIQEGLNVALAYGIKLEHGKFGLRTTGIKSHGDLAANYSGLQFWNSLSGVDNPYFKCVDNNWKQVRLFDFRDYVNPAWDEAINCSDFKSKGLIRTFSNRTKFLEEEASGQGFHRRFQCPVAPNECVKMKKIYGNKADQILHTNCLNAQPESESFKHSAQVSSEELGTSKYTNKQPLSVSAGKESTGVQ